MYLLWQATKKLCHDQSLAIMMRDCHRHKIARYETITNMNGRETTGPRKAAAFDKYLLLCPDELCEVMAQNVLTSFTQFFSPFFDDRGFDLRHLCRRRSLPR